jgi:hypothetical protein
MLRDVVIHMDNEQPLMADLAADPTALDTCVICTNLRTMSGKTPVFAERSDSTFVFPMAHIRFVEIRPASVQDGDAAAATDEAADARLVPGPAGSGMRAVSDAAASSGPQPQRLAWVGDGLGAPDVTSDNGRLDELELLRRVREA